MYKIIIYVSTLIFICVNHENVEDRIYVKFSICNAFHISIILFRKQ